MSGRAADPVAGAASKAAANRRRLCVAPLFAAVLCIIVG